MNNTILQAMMWLVAGGTMYLFLRRRRARRTSKR
jgi:hypothetical protein